MKIQHIVCLWLLSFFALSSSANAQVDEDETGAWYMYMWNKSLENSNFGFQGDIQHRNWDLGGDLEQLLIRAGATWSPEDSGITYTLHWAWLTSLQALMVGMTARPVSGVCTRRR